MIVSFWRGGGRDSSSSLEATTKAKANQKAAQTQENVHTSCVCTAPNSYDSNIKAQWNAEGDLLLFLFNCDGGARITLMTFVSIRAPPSLTL